MRLAVGRSALLCIIFFFDLDHLNNGTNWSASLERSECGPERSFLWPWEAEIFIRESGSNEPVACEYVIISRTFYCDVGTDCLDYIDTIARGYTTKEGRLLVPSVWRKKALKNIQTFDNDFFATKRPLRFLDDGYGFQMRDYKLADTWLEKRDREPNTIYVTKFE